MNAMVRVLCITTIRLSILLPNIEFLQSSHYHHHLTSQPYHHQKLLPWIDDPPTSFCLYRHYHRLCLPPYHAVPQVVLKTSVLCTQHVPRASTLRRPAPLLPTLGARTVQPDYSKLCRQPMALRRTHAAPLRSVLRASTPRSPAMLQSRFAARNVHWDYSKLSPRSASIRLTPALTTPVVPRASTPR